MLSHISIKNYQSLGDVALEVKPFTVIVGPSSSGKSAFTRALKLLTSNQRGDSFITHGQKQTIVTAKVDRGTVAILRGKDNEYRIIPEDRPEEQQVWTKLAGATPEEVSSFIGIPSKDPLNYANQFDMPYLLTDSAGEVARTMGELTNVSVIFDAAREANRRRLDASKRLNIRTSDYADLTQDLDKFVALDEDNKILEGVEARLAEAQEDERKIDRLTIIIQSLGSVVEPPAPRTLPDITGATKLAEMLKTLDNLIATVQRAYGVFIEAEQSIDELQQMQRNLADEYTEALRSAGTCPTCGQDTHDLAEHSE